MTKIDFKKLSEESRLLISTYNDLSDYLNPVEISVEKADFLIKELQENYTMEAITENHVERWARDHDRICELIDIIRDYTWEVKNALAKVQQDLTEKTDRLRSGGGLENGGD